MNNRNIVHSIFVEYFGEQNVDLQEDTIIVHFPYLTVTNENDRSVNITHLFVKVKVDTDGQERGYFTMNRSEYTLDQFRSKYCHSHLPRIDYNYLEKFNSPCLGSGPIRHTQDSLNINFDEEIWQLFCFELDQYVRRESLAGGPYIRMETIGTGNSTDSSWQRVESNLYIFEDISLIDMSRIRADIIAVINRFMPYLINKKALNFVYNNGTYGIAASPYVLTVKLSNVFIEWYNQLPNDSKPEVIEAVRVEDILEPMKVNGEVFYKKSVSNFSTVQDYNQFIGIPICIFKGVRYNLNITGLSALKAENSDENTSLIMKEILVRYIIDKILTIVNYEYGRKNKNIAATGTFFTSISEDTRVL